MSLRFASVVGILLMTGTPGSAADNDAAHLLAQSCSGCHRAVTGEGGVVPAIVGRDSGELSRLLLQFKRHERPATVMNRIARGYTDGELQSLAEHFGSAAQSGS